MRGSFQLVAEATLEQLPLFHAIARSFARSAGAPDDVAEQLALAVEELASNAMLHTYARAKRGPLRFGGEWEGRRIVLRVLHRGRAVDRAVFPDKDCNIGPGRRGGMGLIIAQRAADRLTLVCAGGWRGFRLEREFTPRPEPAP